MNKPTRIYVLKDPRTDEIRYVGKTVKTLQGRLNVHMSNARSGHLRHCARWIRGLLLVGLQPVIEEIELVTDDWGRRERFWISHYKAAGCNLTNHTEGGEGHLGHSPSAATRKKIGDASRGRRHSQESKTMISAARKAWYTTDAGMAYVERLVARNAQGQSLESRRKIAEAATNKKHTDATKQKISNANSGRKRSRAARQQMKSSWKARKIRGDYAKGSDFSNSKLIESDVIVIKRRLATGETPGRIARDYPVTDATIWKIQKGVRWRHVEVPV
jgi:hypothetical protein